VIVAAVGKRNVLTADMVKPGAVVIDVGMNRNDEGKLCGDVDFDGVKNRGRLDHPGARRRGPHDHHHAAGQHPGSRRTRGGLIVTLPIPNSTYRLRLRQPPSYHRHDEQSLFSTFPTCPV
jgi:hypothetical protein